MSDLSSRQINQLKQEFLALDENGDGTIPTGDLAKLLRGIKNTHKITEKDITRIVCDCDQDGSGTIKVYEFLGAIANKKDRDIIIKAFTIRSAIRKQFVDLDKNKDGYITREEFKKSLEKTSKSKLSKAQMDKIMQNADANGDNKIDYDEFITAMTL